MLLRFINRTHEECVTQETMGGYSLGTRQRKRKNTHKKYHEKQKNTTKEKKKKTFVKWT